MTSSDQYAQIAASYAEAEVLPIRQDAEFPTFLAALGPVAGAQVLDLACGTGAYCRLLVRHGARRVVGVDASAPMIELARAQVSPADPIEFRVHDAGTLPDLGRFDVVTAAFLLNYARTADELATLCGTVARHLRPGGRFTGALPNPGHDPRRFDTRYQVTYGWGPAPADGEPFSFRLHLPRAVEIEAVYWRLETYWRALAAAGLGEIEFRTWLPTAAALARDGADFWQPWLGSPLCLVVTAVSPPR